MADDDRDPHDRQVLTAFQAELDRHPLPRSFSGEALTCLLDRQTEFLEELGLEAIRIARKKGNHDVQPINVDHADDVVRSKPAAPRSFLQTFGGLLWGAAISEFAQEIAASSPRWWLVGLATFVLVGSTIMLMYGLFGDRH